MDILEDIPVSLQQDDIFKKLFAIAEFSNLTPEEMNAYQQSLKIKRDNYSGMEYAIATAVTEAKQKAEKEKKEMAVVLKNKNVSTDIIVEATGLTIEEIEAL